MNTPAPESTQSTPLTLMAVHAHPDDEVVFTGGILPVYHDRGVRTVLVCCTGGEEGEIHDPDLDPDEARPRLGAIRAGELAGAVKALDIDVLEMLGYRDSGMAGTEANANPACFHQAPRDEATAKLVALVRRYQPQVLVTYNDFGSYGHPDHIAAHQITMAAYDLAADPAYRPDLGAPWAPLKLYYTAWPEESFEKARAMYQERGLKWPWDEDEKPEDTDPEHQSDEEGVSAEMAEETKPAEPEKPKYEPPPVTTRIDVRAGVARKIQAFLCHRTQFMHEGLFMSMPEDIAPVAFGEDDFTLVRSRIAAPTSETCLFAGITAPALQPADQMC
jgi:LmbE family N-acetylglucosaminyl deacetylase